MHYVKIFVFAAALAMAACDSSAEPGDEPDTATTTDTVSETGKGDSPYSRDTSFSDSDGEGIDAEADSSTDDTAMVPETINNEECPPSTLDEGSTCTPGNCTLKRMARPECGWECLQGSHGLWAQPTDAVEQYCTTGVWPPR